MFRAFDSLRVFNVVAQSMSITRAATELNLTKGAVSYQIKRLEDNLGFDLFMRQHSRISLTDKGKLLLQTTQPLFAQIESEISNLKTDNSRRITIGMSTYFASRWLMPRLMKFTAIHPDISLRLQPMADLIDLASNQIDLAIRWGDGRWSDMVIEKLFSCPAKVTAGKIIARQVRDSSLKETLSSITLLHDRDDSEAWQTWYQKAGLSYAPKRTDLVISDPNVRVEAVINGQGIALNDILVDHEIQKKLLFQISPVELDDYGYYLAYPEKAMDNPALKIFRQWIIDQA